MKRASVCIEKSAEDHACMSAMYWRRLGWTALDKQLDSIDSRVPNDLISASTLPSCRDCVSTSLPVYLGYLFVWLVPECHQPGAGSHVASTSQTENSHISVAPPESLEILSASQLIPCTPIPKERPGVPDCFMPLFLRIDSMINSNPKAHFLSASKPTMRSVPMSANARKYRVGCQATTGQGLAVLKVWTRSPVSA